MADDDKYGICTLVLRSGQTLDFKCKSVATKRDMQTGALTSLTMDKMERTDSWIYLRLDAIEAVLWEPYRD